MSYTKAVVAVFILLILIPQAVLAFISIDSTYIIFHFRGTDTSSSLGSSISCLGDINGDGFDDIAISSNSPEGFYIFYGGNPVDTFPDMLIKGNLGPASAIDLTGDGINEVITSDYFKVGFKETGVIYFYLGYQDSIASEPYDSLYPGSGNFGFGGRFRTGYVDSDSLGDLLTYEPNTPGGPTIYFYSGCPTLDTVADWTYKINDYSHGISRFEFIDFNGNHQLDICLGLYADLDTIGYVYIFLGPAFKSNPDTVIGYPVEIDPDILGPEYFGGSGFNVGDVDGDGWEDLGVLYAGHSLIYKCGPGADTIYDYELERRSGYMAPAGDVNGDGENDVIAYNKDRSYLMQPLHGVDIYLGGQIFDTTIDDSVFHDDIPDFVVEKLGWRISTAGNFNGDEYDDFMFSCTDIYTGEPKGDVFVVKGSADITTDVDEDIPGNLPDQFRLKQNYPNPFNRGTTIEFSLPHRDKVTLEIFNILGEKIVTLLDQKAYQAGTYRVTWGGRLADGSAASSGVYLYRLSSSSGSNERKMLLLK